MDRLIEMLDIYLNATAPKHIIDAWKEIRKELRRGRKISSTTLPALSTAAQHAVAARDHAQKSLEAMGAITTPQVDDEKPEPEPEKS